MPQRSRRLTRGVPTSCTESSTSYAIGAPGSSMSALLTVDPLREAQPTPKKKLLIPSWDLSDDSGDERVLQPKGAPTSSAPEVGAKEAEVEAARPEVESGVATMKEVEARERTVTSRSVGSKEVVPLASTLRALPAPDEHPFLKATMELITQCACLESEHNQL